VSWGSGAFKDNGTRVEFLSASAPQRMTVRVRVGSQFGATSGGQALMSRLMFRARISASCPVRMRRMARPGWRSWAGKPRILGELRIKSIGTWNTIRGAWGDASGGLDWYGTAPQSAPQLWPGTTASAMPKSTTNRHCRAVATQPFRHGHRAGNEEVVGH
jgi:hypothetical protein